MYKYLIIDGQYLLTRNFKLLASRNPEFRVNELITVTFQSVAKLRRDLVNFEKPILLFDKSPYHKLSQLPDYKCGRHYVTESDLVDIDPSDEESILECKREILLNQKKQSSKYWLLEYFPKMGIPCYLHEGYEADDLAYLFSIILKNKECKSAVCSSDSDWKYFSNEFVDYIKFNGAVTDFESIKSEYKDVFDTDITLYSYKSYCDSLYGSHNDLIQTYDVTSSNLESNVDRILRLRNKDYSILSNQDRFHKQLESFDVMKYPDIDLVLTDLESTLSSGQLLTDDEFTKFSSDNLLKISLKYYKDFISRLNNSLY